MQASRTWRSDCRRLAWTAGIFALALLPAAVILRAMGRSWWCQCGKPDLWSWHIWSMHNSQHLIDPYTFTHVLHGLLFYGILFIALRRAPALVRFGLALGIEAGWEILENTNRMIERYREVTISLDYFGDSVINSLADILACALGYGLAAVLPAWISIGLFVATESILLLWIRDSLVLNILMLVFPVEAIKNWQMGK